MYLRSNAKIIIKLKINVKYKKLFTNSVRNGIGYIILFLVLRKGRKILLTNLRTK